MGFRVIAELAPGRRLDKFVEKAASVSRYADAIDIPDAPLGEFRGLAAIAAVLVWERIGVDAIPHVRLNTHSLDGIVDIVVGLEASGIKETVLLQGDPPRLGPGFSYRTEDVVGVLRRFVSRVRIGGLISLRYPLEKIVERIRAAFDFFLLLRFTGANPTAMEVSRILRRLSKPAYPYVIVATERNAHLFEKGLAGQPIVRLADIGERIMDIAGLFDGVVVSCPGDYEGLLTALQAVRRSVGY